MFVLTDVHHGPPAEAWGRLRPDFGECGWTCGGKRNAWGTDDDERCDLAAAKHIFEGQASNLVRP